MLSNWALREGPSLEVERQDGCCTALCWAAGHVTHMHELVIRNVSNHEEVSGSGLLHCLSSSLILFIQDRWLLLAE